MKKLCLHLSIAFFLSTYARIFWKNKLNLFFWSTEFVKFLLSLTCTLYDGCYTSNPCRVDIHLIRSLSIRLDHSLHTHIVKWQIVPETNRTNSKFISTRLARQMIADTHYKHRILCITIATCRRFCFFLQRNTGTHFVLRRNCVEIGDRNYKFSKNSGNNFLKKLLMNCKY